MSGILVLVFGLALFLGTHASTMAQGNRDTLIVRFGAAGYRGLYSVSSLVGLALMVWGFGLYRSQGYVPVWSPPPALQHLNLIIMLPVFVLLAAAYRPGRIRSATKHPMLLAVKIWAAGHLLANGDLGSMLLFGGFLAWAVLARISMKRRPAAAGPVATGWSQGDAVAFGAGLVLYGLTLIWLHPLLIGVPALPGR